MKSIETRIIITAIIFVLIIVTGLFLRKKGKPYSLTITTLHKLLSLVIIILCASIVYNQHTIIGLSFNEMIIVTVSAIFFLSAIVTGGLLTIKKPMPYFVLLLHKISSGFFIGVCAFVILQFY